MVASARSALAAALAIGACLLAYRHGQLSAQGSECACGHVPTSMLHREEEQLNSIPASERTMVSCMLQTPELRDVLRKRFHSCLYERGALDPASAAALISSPPPPPAVAERMPVEQQVQPQQQQRALGESSSSKPLDPLLARLEAAREVEDAAVGASRQGRGARPVVANSSPPQPQPPRMLGSSPSRATPMGDY